MKLPSNLIQLRVLAFTLVLIIVPFFAGYYFWISSQTKYFNGRNLRILAALSTHVQEKVENQSSVFKNAVEKYVRDIAAKRLKEQDDESTDNELVTVEQIKKKDHKENFQKKALDPLSTDGAANLQATNVTVVSKPANELLSSPRIGVKEEASEHWLYYEYAVAYPPKAPNPTTYLNVTARINLEQLVGPLVNKREMQENQGPLYQDGFDAVLIAGLDDQMTILFQESSAKMRMLSLNNLTTATGGKVDLKLLGQSTNTSDVRLGPADYKLFLQPIQLPLNADANKPESLRWVACGLVEGIHFEQQRMAVSYNVLIAFGFITVLVAVSWSFLKLLFMGPKDRFRKLDAYMLGFAAFMMAALLTLGALFYYFYNATLTAGEADLEQFAGRIQKNFYSELGDALIQIDELNSKLDQKTIAAAKKVDESNLDKLAFRSAIMDDGLVTPRSPYPYLLTAFWANDQGWQQIKWTLRPSVTNRVKVSERDYFSKLRLGRHYNFDDPAGTNHEFWIEPITSSTTGSRAVVISKLVADKFGPNTKWVSGIETRPVSLMQPVIPEGFGFAIIEDSGKVIFHSAPKLHLGENFFEECDNNQELQAAVLGRSTQSLTGSYFGKGHSLYVTPMAHLPWTLVVFNEKDSLRTTFSEILSLCLILFISYVVVLCVLLLASYLTKCYVFNRRSPDGSAWMWPDEGKRAVYLESILLNSVLVVLSCLAVFVLPNMWQLWLPALVAAVAVAFFVCRLKHAKSQDETNKCRWFNYRKAYILNFTLLCCLTSIVPAYACFKIAYVQEMKLFIVNGQLSLAKGMVAREERIRGQGRSIYRNPRYQAATQPENKSAQGKRQRQHATPVASPTPRLVKQRLEEQRDVYDSFFCQTKQSQQAAPEKYPTTQQNWLLGFFMDLVPLFDHSSIARHALTEKAADNSSYWDDSSGTTLVLHAREQQRNNSGPSERLIKSSLPSLGGALWWVLLPHVFVCVWLLLLYMIWQLFLFRINEPECDDLQDSCVDSKSPSRLLVLRPHFVGKDQLLERMGLNGAHRFDMKRVSRLSKWENELNAKTGPVVLENFDYGMDNTDHTKHKLEFLEALRKENRTTIALSTIDAGAFSSANGKIAQTNGHLNGHSNGDKNGNTNGDKTGDTNGVKNGSVSVMPVRVSSDRWTDALSWFLKNEPNDSGNADSFHEKLKESKDKLVGRSDLDAQTIESSFALIEKECSPRAYLQNVGLAIARQSNVGKVSTAVLLKQISSSAKPYYAAIWDDCTGEQKLTLTRLAQYGLLSPKDPDTPELLGKGLIVRDPAIRIMNESFRLFILSMHMDDELAQCEKKAKVNSNWEALKVPLTIGLLSIAAFLLLTQRELYNSAVPFIGGLAAALPSFLKLLSLFRPGAKAE